MNGWEHIHLALWCAAFGNLYSAWYVERTWSEGWWLRARPWFVRFAVAGAVWCVYVAGAMVPFGDQLP